MKLRVSRNKKGHTKSKDSLIGLLKLGVANLFFMFSCIENYYKIDLDSHLKRWQEFSHDFEGRVIFTRIRYKMRVLIH